MIKGLFRFTPSRLVWALAGLSLLAALFWAAPRPPAATAQSAGYSLRFFGAGVGDIDRVKIALTTNRPVDVAGDFTLEFWLRAELAENGAAATCNTNNGWITGNIVFDRDVFGGGDRGDYGLSLSNGRVAFGVGRAGNGQTVCGGTVVADGAWHHIAVTRANTGQLRIFVDGQPDGQANGPSGDVGYRDGRPSNYPNSDPYLVIGAEKHDLNPNLYPPFTGWLDEVRLSNVLRYTTAFSPSVQAFAPDSATVALYHFDEGAGTLITDSSEAAGGPSHGERRVGGDPEGPAYSLDTPLSAPPTPTPTATATVTATPAPTLTPTPTSTPVVVPCSSGCWRVYLPVVR